MWDRPLATASAAVRANASIDGYPTTSGGQDVGSGGEEGTGEAATGQSFEARARRVVAEHVPDGDLDAMEVMFHLLRAAARVVHDLETNVHRPMGLTWAGFRVLFCTWVDGPLPAHEIARLSNVSRASISSVLGTLERRGLLTRTRSSTDRRVVHVELTARGRSHMAAHWRRQNDRERQWASAVDPDRRAAFVDALSSVLRLELPTATDEAAGSAPPIPSR